MFTLFITNNSIFPLNLAPYHDPSTNRVAELAVITFKQGMKKLTDGDLRD